MRLLKTEIKHMLDFSLDTDYNELLKLAHMFKFNTKKLTRARIESLQKDAEQLARRFQKYLVYAYQKSIL